MSSETSIPSDKRPAHISVLYHEVLQVLQPASPGRYVDATVGAGGHAQGILEACPPLGQLLGLDRDPAALALASQRLSLFEERAILVQASYITLLEQLEKLGWDSVNGILLDLGVSSMQIDTPERGFSFLQDGPLDMRFDPAAALSAADLINTLPEAELANILWLYGEERQSRHIAHAICQARPLHTTRQLADLVKRTLRGKHTIHPATRTFQALRIAVNQELQAVETLLPQAIQALAPGGRLAIISFHSLEDRIVKQFFRRESRDCICPPEQPICTCSHRASILDLTKHPIQPEETESANNPRARSARMRVAEKRKLA